MSKTPRTDALLAKDIFIGFKWQQMEELCRELETELNECKVALSEAIERLEAQVRHQPQDNA